MPVGERISWLVCTVESKACLREYDVVEVIGDGCTAVTVHVVASVNVTQ
jgi:hypothetical protein